MLKYSVLIKVYIGFSSFCRRILQLYLKLARNHFILYPYALAALYPQEDSWYSFLLEAESTSGLLCGWKD
jgi:hypothetical protein